MQLHEMFNFSLILCKQLKVWKKNNEIDAVCTKIIIRLSIGSFSIFLLLIKYTFSAVWKYDIYIKKWVFSSFSPRMYLKYKWALDERNLFFTVFNLNSDVMPHDSSDVIKRYFRPNCVEFESRVSMSESIFNFID